MSSEVEITQEIMDRVEEIHQMNFFESENQRQADHKEAMKYLNRWLNVIRSELELMEKEGIDPYIAWLSFVDTTNRCGSVDHIGDLHPSKC